MSRSTVFLGNGVGMALDPEHFSLSTAMEKVWEKDVLSEIHKKVIQSCLKLDGVGSRPSSEDHMNTLHKALNACYTLIDIDSDGKLILTEDGVEFPPAIIQYLTKVAWHFSSGDYELPNSFFEPLSEFISETKSHVVTSNYDHLLYKKMIDSNLLSGYEGHLVDGFWSDGFHEDNLERKYSRDFGYYLHIHGSPLFIEEPFSRKIKKLTLNTIRKPPTSHIVLTHVDHKTSVIDQSYVLNTYSHYFDLALQESDSIYIVGYSGLDTHINRKIFSHSDGRDIIVVEWEGAIEDDNRQRYWKRKLGAETITYYSFENILDFHDWA